LNSQGRLIIFCGIPGSGKTTIAKIVAERLGSVVHIQTDAIRSMISKPRYSRTELRFAYRSVTAVAREALKNEYDVILDGTFLKEEFRDEALHRLAGLYRSALLVHVACDFSVAYERNVARREIVPKESFVRLYSRFERPRHALRIDSEKTSPELAAQAILLQIGSDYP
jgi:predicted kinase